MMKLAQLPTLTNQQFFFLSSLIALHKVHKFTIDAVRAGQSGLGHASVSGEALNEIIEVNNGSLLVLLQERVERLSKLVVLLF